MLESINQQTLLDQLAALRQENEQLRSYLIEWPPDAVIVVDAEGKIVAVNHHAEHMFGYVKQELVGQLVEVLMPDQYRGPHADYRTEYSRAPKYRPMGQTRLELYARRKDGSVFPADINLNPIQRDGTVVAAIRDLTQRNQIERSLREAKEQAESAAKAKSIFLANMSHEFRTPLNAILGFAQLLEHSPTLSPQDRNQIAAIQRSGECLLEIITDVLNMARLETGRIALQTQVFDLRRLLQDLTIIFHHRAQSMCIFFSIEVAEAVPSTVEGDEGKLRQALLNMLGNAVKFTHSGWVALRVNWRGGKALFEVEDTGPGIAPSELAGIFEPFVQTEAGARALEGTGLGLAICKKYVELMGGTIEAASAVGVGSVFRCEIPLTPVEVPNLEPQRLEPCVGLEEGQSSIRLLVVDDQPDDCELLTALLSRLGFEVRSGDNGREAIEIWKEWSPHLIWMNLRMPVLNGLEAAKTIRTLESEHVNEALPIDSGAEPQNRPTRTVIIAVAANTYDQVQEDIASAGFDDFLSKPFKKETLVEKIHHHLGVRFRYEAFTGQVDATGVSSDNLKKQLAHMPVKWKADLYQALMVGDMNQALSILEQTPPPSSSLVDELRQRIQRFCFEELMEMLEHSALLDCPDTRTQTPHR